MTHAVYPSLSNKTVVITGGGSGIGEIIVSANNEGGGAGAAYLFYGRTVEAWRALQTATDRPPGATCSHRSSDVFLPSPRGRAM